MTRVLWGFCGDVVFILSGWMATEVRKRAVGVRTVVGPVSNINSGEGVPGVVRATFTNKGYYIRVSFARCPKRTDRLAQGTLSGKTGYIVTIKKSKAIGRVTHTVLRSNTILKVVPGNSNGNLTHRLRVPVSMHQTVSLVMGKRISAVSYYGTGKHIFFYAYKINFSTTIDRGFTKRGHHNSLACVGGAIRRCLDCGPRPCRLLVSGRAIGRGTFLITYKGTSRCNGGTFVTPRTGVRSNGVSVAVLSPFNPLSVTPLTVRLFAGRVSHGDGVGAFGKGRIAVVHRGPKIVRLSKRPVVTSDQVRVSILPGSLGMLAPRAISFARRMRGLFNRMAHFFSGGLPCVFEWGSLIELVCSSMCQYLTVSVIDQSRGTKRTNNSSIDSTGDHFNYTSNAKVARASFREGEFYI